MKKGLYAGSFDPITKGHIAVIRQSLKIVDRLDIMVAANPDKKGMFSTEERVKLIRDSLKDELLLDEWLSVTIYDASSSNLTVEYARMADATILIRGLRNGADYAYERSLAAINRKLDPDIETIFVPTPAEFEEVSSSMVKGLMKYRNGEVAARDFVTPNVLEAIRNKSFF